MAAFVTLCGWPVTVRTLNDAKRRGKLTLGTAQHLTAEEERFALMLFFARPGCELEGFAAEGSPARATLERLREEANERAYDDDFIPEEAWPDDWLLDAECEDGQVGVVAGATPPHIAHAPPCLSNRERGEAKLLLIKGRWRLRGTSGFWLSDRSQWALIRVGGT